jgi:hypothetical protein
MSYSTDDLGHQECAAPSLCCFFLRVVSLRHTIIPIFLGVILLVAAGTKTYDLITSSFPEMPLHIPQWLWGWLLAFELLLGSWLIFPWHPHLVRTVALITFGGFLVSALFLALSGVSSCACFGTFKVNPWTTTFLDLCAMVALWFWRPNSDFLGAAPKVLLPTAFVACFLALGLTFSSVAQTPKSTSLLTPLTPEIDLGTVASGSSSNFEFSLRNLGSRRVLLGPVQTSCPCLRVILARAVVDPSEDLEGNATLDLNGEPEFVGNLAIQVRGLTTTGQDAFRMQIRARVKHEIHDQSR